MRIIITTNTYGKRTGYISKPHRFWLYYQNYHVNLIMGDVLLLGNSMIKKILLIVLVLLILALIYPGCAVWREIGQTPKGERLDRIRQSPHFQCRKRRIRQSDADRERDERLRRRLWNC